MPRLNRNQLRQMEIRDRHCYPGESHVIADSFGDPLAPAEQAALDEQMEADEDAFAELRLTQMYREYVAWGRQTPYVAELPDNLFAGKVVFDMAIVVNPLTDDYNQVIGMARQAGALYEQPVYAPSRFSGLITNYDEDPDPIGHMEMIRYAFIDPNGDLEDEYGTIPVEQFRSLLSDLKESDRYKNSLLAETVSQA